VSGTIHESAIAHRSERQHDTGCDRGDRSEAQAASCSTQHRLRRRNEHGDGAHHRDERKPPDAPLHRPISSCVDHLGASAGTVSDADVLRAIGPPTMSPILRHTA
jgi:hypothetical protein